MRIPLPNKLIDWIAKRLAPIVDWLNAPLVWRFRRIDVVIAIGGILCTAYYWYVGGWQGALYGALMYIMMTMIGLWFIR